MGESVSKFVQVEGLIDESQEVGSVVVGDHVLSFVGVVQVIELRSVLVSDGLDGGLAHFRALIAADVEVVALEHLKSDVLRSDLRINQSLNQLRAESQLAVEG